MTSAKKEKKLSEQEAFLKISAWCAYQERSHSEVRHRLYEIGTKTDIIEEIIFKLIQENFLNEERFARTYAGGKFRLKKWGRLKIRQGLKQKEVSEACIRLGMEEISDEDYYETLYNLLEKKAAALSGEKNLFVRKRKMAEFAIRKGYEMDLVWDIIRGMEECL